MKKKIDRGIVLLIFVVDEIFLDEVGFVLEIFIFLFLLFICCFVYGDL